MNFAYLQNQNHDYNIHTKLKKAEKEINDLKEQMENIWLKHVFYNTTLFVLGVSALSMYILSPDNIKTTAETMKETIKETIQIIRESADTIMWEIVNQSIYVIDGKILIFGMNPLLTPTLALFPEAEN